LGTKKVHQKQILPAGYAFAFFPHTAKVVDLHSDQVAVPEPQRGSVADVRLGPVFCQKIQTPNLAWGLVQVKLLDLELDIGPVHKGFCSALNRFGPERTAKKSKFLFFSRELMILAHTLTRNQPRGL
jgi:hypothetical protein